MAAKKLIKDNITFVVTPEVREDDSVRVEVSLPPLPGQDDESQKVDKYEHVTIANEEHEECYKVMRGERVEVPVPVFMALKARYPKI